MTDYEKLKKEFDFSLLKKNQNDIGVLEKNLNVIIENYAVLKLLIDELSDFKGKLFDKVYPVGSVFISVSSVSPESLFGGKWERIKGRFLLAADDTYKAGSLGGEAAVSLTTEQNGSHGHNFNVAGNDKVTSGVRISLGLPGTVYSGEVTVGVGSDWTSSGYVTITESGKGEAHNNMPPYLSVYVWQRTE